MMPQNDWAIAAATPQGRVSLAFARALAAGEYERAHQMLTPAAQADLPPATLQANFNSLWHYVVGDTAPDQTVVICAMEDWPDKRPADIGWAYVAVSGPHPQGGVWNEAVTVIVATESGHLLIRDVEWGRP